ncbi:MAG TPA: glutaredoxin family protein, partial [Thermoanaerobaculia bacterium]
QSGPNRTPAVRPAFCFGIDGAALRSLPMVEVVLYTRQNCSLCDRAKAAILEARVAEMRLKEIDIDGDPATHDLYTDHVPVIFVDGRETFRHFVHPEEFAEAVRRAISRKASDAASIGE